MSQPDPTPPEPVRPSETTPAAIPVSTPRGMVLGATAVLSGFVLFQAPMLYNEWRELRNDWEFSRVSEPVGFLNIAPNPSFATMPEPWHKVEGAEMLLWSGWTTDTKQHDWFHIGATDLDLAQLKRPIGRDVVRAIRYPVAEVGGGTIWNRLQPDMPIVTVDTPSGTPTAYPLLLLKKVEVVNDPADGQPVLIVHTPFVKDAEAIHIFNPQLNGERLTFGLSGHFQEPGPRPLLYDDQTQSLWAQRDSGLTCVAGPHKGQTLPEVGTHQSHSWNQWKESHPQGRLIVGAFRTPPEA